MHSHLRYVRQVDQSSIIIQDQRDKDRDREGKGKKTGIRYKAKGIRSKKVLNVASLELSPFTIYLVP